MASSAAAGTAAHPAPHRGRTSVPALLFGLGGAPLAWSGQMLVNYFLSSYGCYPGENPRAAVLESWRWAVPASYAVSAVAAVVAVAAALVAWRAWRATRAEHHGRHEQLMEIGEGRSRFLALCGLITSVGFLIAIFSAALSFWVPLCGH